MKDFLYNKLAVVIKNIRINADFKPTQLLFYAGIFEFRFLVFKYILIYVIWFYAIEILLFLFTFI